MPLGNSRLSPVRVARATHPYLECVHAHRAELSPIGEPKFAAMVSLYSIHGLHSRTVSAHPDPRCSSLHVRGKCLIAVGC
ncbi:hypothetical protein BD626DRAFT_509791 [Schizophyllum amplum]|uniref:Uncharacterized protein n=1 Tax=Schizophyllum amplum TaxID=97359 RepID=A0A550C2U2_9AGAR|nr:hypothetical protein BD626DRAFT_509764 [Auriculariopsis ampla]TRM59108.1 hypothetical protein BD626DRAFT_509791 [Auriculariopsis ampla]